MTITDANRLSLAEIFSETIGVYENTEKARRQEARFAQEQIDMNLAFAQTAEDKEREEAIEDDLFE